VYVGMTERRLNDSGEGRYNTGEAGSMGPEGGEWVAKASWRTTHEGTGLSQTTAGY